MDSARTPKPAPRIALAFPYFRTRALTEMLFPPLGLAVLAAQLRRLGLETRIFDGTFSTPEELGRDVVAYRPDIVGVTSMVSLTANTLRLAELVRGQLPEALLVAGGPLPTVFPQRYSKRFDAVVRGEADLSFPRLCRDYLERGLTPATLDDLPLATYPGLFVDRPDLQVANATAHHSEVELATFPLPDRSDYDHAAYQREWLRTTGARSTSLIATLGCPYACEFCSKPIFGTEVRRRPLDAVFAEIEQIRALGYDSLWIADDTFTLRPDHLQEFCRRISGSGVRWSCLSRANGIDATTARLMKQAGCTRVYLGLESGSQATLDLMNKRITVEEGVRAAHVYRDAGLEVAAFFIVGYPGETEAAIETTFELALTLPLDEISFNVPVPLPGSALWERLGGPDDGRDWSHENEVTFVFDSDVDEEWLGRRVDETMAAFAARKAS